VRLFHFTSSEHGLSAIKNSRLKVATIRDLNDPFELLCVDAPNRRTRNALSEFKNRLSARNGMLCFNPGWSNPLMWSHYAKKHSGVALELDVSESALFNVRYTASRVPWNIPRILATGGFSSRHADAIFATKSSHWRYEEERRVAIRLSECQRDGGLYFEPFSPGLKLTGIIVGPLSEVSDADLKGVLPRGATIKVRKARLAHRSFDIVADRRVRPHDVTGSA
jgi:hypothetical protein